MRLGKLDFKPVKDSLNLIGEPTKNSIKANALEDVLVAEIDPELSDTEAFCDKYGIGIDVAVNCVIVEAKRADKVWYAACLVPATVRADINGIVRRHLGAKKISFAPLETATSLSDMAFGGITPIGLPADWPILVDSGAAVLEHAVIGSGIRESKLLVSGKLLASLPNTEVLALTKTN
jgi:prolyl-tRNA editing enzyme YbaK/EbsC (Cys-tRNA(Pro) deacylase)